MNSWDRKQNTLNVLAEKWLVKKLPKNTVEERRALPVDSNTF